MRGFSTHPGDDGMQSQEPAAPAESELESELLEQSLGIAELVAERDNYLDQLQRTAADYANYRRRTETERVQMRKNATRELVTELAPIADDFERAIANIPEAQANSSLAEGVRLIERKLGDRAGAEQAGRDRLQQVGERGLGGLGFRSIANADLDRIARTGQASVADLGVT